MDKGTVQTEDLENCVVREAMYKISDALAMLENFDEATDVVSSAVVEKLKNLKRAYSAFNNQLSSEVEWD